MREIPGFFYDSEKKKYFKIQASGSGPASSAYSNQDVQRRKALERENEAKALDERRQQGRIKRSKINFTTLSGGLLDREQSRHLGSLDAARILAGGLIPQGRLPFLKEFASSSDPLFDIEPRPDLGPSLADISLLFDDRHFTVRVNADKYTRTTKHLCIDICHEIQLRRIQLGSWRLQRYGDAGVSTSVTTNDGTRQIAMSWLSSVPSSGIAIWPISDLSEHGGVDPPGLILGPGTIRGDNVSVYTAAASPPSSSLSFAFGSSRGILAVDKLTSDTNWISPDPKHASKVPRDVFALEFLSESPQVLLSGSRSGILHIIDLRAPQHKVTNDTLTHPSTITHIKQLNAHKILVSGLHSSLLQYDLRYRKPSPTTQTPPISQSQSQSQSQNKKQKQNRPPNPSPTIPFQTYPSHQNNATIQLGLDVDTSSGLIAAAQEYNPNSRIHTPVSIFSLETGSLLPSCISKYLRGEDGLEGSGRIGATVVRGGRSGREREGNVDWDIYVKSEGKNVKCVKWVEDVVGRGKSLYIGAEGGLRRFAWGDRGEGDFGC